MRRFPSWVLLNRVSRKEKFAHQPFNLGPFKKLKVAEIKEKIWNECLLKENQVDQSIRLSSILSKINSTMPEGQPLKIQAAFLMLLHLANEKNIKLESLGNDVLVSI